MNRFTLDGPPFAGLDGSGVRIGIIDSGINPANPHVGAITGGVHIAEHSDGEDWIDRLGHGTAVAAAIREKAPAAELLAIRVFDRSLLTSADRLGRAIRWAAVHRCHLINLSLGTANAERESVLSPAIAQANAAGCIVVSARASDGVIWLPGCLPGVAGVLLDRSLARTELRLETDGTGSPVFHTSGLPRPIPGVPAERNVSGISFAVANATGFLARLVGAAPALSVEAREITGRPDRPLVVELAGLIESGGKAYR